MIRPYMHLPEILHSAGGEAPRITFAANQPPELHDRLSRLSAWSITPSKMGITREFIFPSFHAAWHFMDIVAGECKTKQHHPSWHNLYNRVTIEWTTHKPLGLSIKDVEMAELCDRVADQVGLRKKT
ncbi:pterin 4 alpha carbinolamine dehydratase-domain-containing protein [Massariosphaeria phaeospora]|uniref:4a-hydroxytetrahydrobiopterin dehydratase n=1 Tax=Massariosphaeria phaeospora TaxID=100035 RepID=A0A7C8IA37_9PLEO|nr:pterin 4 alpha carbinolamine dehydratase-domain-containing protein [Massariosphaeria phaeospora]